MSNRDSRDRRNVRGIHIGLLLFGAAAVILISACSMSQQVVLRSDGSGTIAFRVELKPSLIAAAKDLSAGSGGGAAASNPGQFDIPKIKEALAKNPSLRVLSLVSPQEGVIAGSVAFTDIASLFGSQTELAGSDVVSVSKSAGTTTVRVHITRDNFSKIAVVSGLSDNPLYQMFGPEQNAATTKSDLNQMMGYVLGSGGPAALDASSVDISVTVQGKIISQQGGTLSGNQVKFAIPLADLLLLAQPLDYAITYS